MENNNESNWVFFPNREEHIYLIQKKRPGVADPIYLRRTKAYWETVDALIGWGLDPTQAAGLVNEIKANTIPHLDYDQAE